MSEFEKKSERIEIRVSHTKKQAFNEACEQGGDTPSGALRRFIDGYIRRADNDAFKDGLRAMGRMAKRRWLPLSAAAAALLVGGYFTGQALKPAPQDGPIVTASTDEFPPIDYALFAAYDKNANGVLDLGEVAKNDEHLHRVLNLDGEAGISPAEFYPKAKMQWQFVERGGVETGEDGAGLPFANLTNITNDLIVDFDLTNIDAPIIKTRPPVKQVVKDINALNADLAKRDIPKSLSKAMVKASKVKIEEGEHVERTVSWEGGKSKPALSFSNHEFRTRNVDKSLVNF